MSVFLLAINSLLIAKSTAKITAYFSNTRNTLLGGQFDPAQGGQFAPAGGGQFLPAKGGQFIRFLQFVLKTTK